MTQERKTLSPQNKTVAKPTVAGLFAGIGGFEIGLNRAGFKTIMLCEIDSYAQEVLEYWKKNAHKDFDKPPFADVDLSQKDITKLKKLPKVTLLTAGFPCQDLSLAGSKAGITGERSGLINEVFRLLESANEESPDWVLLENVSYMLGLENGKAMRVIVDRFETLGYKWAYRELDARSFGVAQRR
ncbi:MAG: hypothetical protein CL916_00005, partial [Deltaproteobacteria bacterium]|nr:hypothetical protein [Deltaproteobacteria bacterium]